MAIFQWSESVHNDTDQIVEVWWQFLEGLRMFPIHRFSQTSLKFGVQNQLLVDPGSTVDSKDIPITFWNGQLHELCVKYSVQNFTTRASPKLDSKCKMTWCPAEDTDHFTYQISDIIQGGQGPWVKPCDKHGTQDKLSAFATRSDCLKYSVPVPCALASFMLALVGFKKFHSLQKPLQGLQETLMHT